MDHKDRYDKGFTDKCAQYGVDPVELLSVMEKHAQQSLGNYAPYDPDYGINVWDSGAFRFLGNIGRNVGRAWDNAGQGIKNWWGGGHGGYRPYLGWMEDSQYNTGLPEKQKISAKAWANMNTQQRMNLLTGAGADRYALPNWNDVSNIEAAKREADRKKFGRGLSRQQAINKRIGSIYKPWERA